VPSLTPGVWCYGQSSGRNPLGIDPMDHGSRLRFIDKKGKVELGWELPERLNTYKNSSSNPEL
jgi:hypothetical protein